MIGLIGYTWMSEWGADMGFVIQNICFHLERTIAITATIELNDIKAAILPIKNSNTLI